MTDVKALIEDSPVIAAVKDEEGLAHCLRTDVKAVFILFGTVCSIPKIVERVKQSGRAALVHLDLVNGLSAREASVDFIREYTRADGIISTRQPLIARAAELGMNNTYYTNATGLPDDAQYTTARDVATLSVEMCRHPDYFKHASVWMDTLTHPSGRVTDLTNTNRLVRFYEGCDGLKTGSADASRYCLSATAQKDGLRFIAIVLGTETSQKRFDEARAMLDYGFANYKRVTVLSKGDRLGQRVPVRLGMADEVEAAVGRGMSMLLKPGQEKQLSLEVELPAEVSAPVRAGDTLGMIRVKLDGSVIARLPAVAAEDVGMPGLLEGFFRVLNNWR